MDTDALLQDYLRNKQWLRGTKPSSMGYIHRREEKHVTLHMDGTKSGWISTLAKDDDPVVEWTIRAILWLATIGCGIMAILAVFL